MVFVGVLIWCFIPGGDGCTVEAQPRSDWGGGARWGEGRSF